MDRRMNGQMDLWMDEQVEAEPVCAGGGATCIAETCMSTSPVSTSEEVLSQGLSELRQEETEM